MQLHDIDAVLTGASGGIGAALAAELCGAGARVLAIGRRDDPLQALLRRWGGARVRPLVADITCAADRERIHAAVRELARPRLLIHAAATGAFGLFAEATDAESASLFDTNVLAPIALTRRLLPLLETQPEATVVAIGSTFGSIGYPGFASYSASKFALRGLFEALSREYADRPLRFQWLAPRATDTGFNSSAVQALNRALGTAVDPAEAVARQLLRAIRRGDPRRQLGWPERLFVRLNGVLPGLVDRGLRPALSTVRLHATPVSPAPAPGVIP